MTKAVKWRQLLIGAVVVMNIIACGGSLRYAERDPDLKDFHPRTIGVLAVDATSYPEAKGAAEEVTIAALVARQWFTTVMTAAALKERLRNDHDLQQTVNDYLLKLKTVNYSDPALSRKIGEGLSLQAFLVVTVDAWSYTVENKEKVARAGLSMKLVEAETGRIAWQAGHDVMKEYSFLKPELKDLGRGVADAMIGVMPH